MNDNLFDKPVKLLIQYRNIIGKLNIKKKPVVPDLNDPIIRVGV